MSYLHNLSIILLYLLFIPTTAPLIAQDLLMTNSKPIDKNKYRDVKGTPYLFEDWVNGKIISNDADVIDDILLNYNGESSEFEIKHNNRFIELNPNWYLRVIVTQENNEEIIFQRSFVAPLKNKFVRLVYKGKNLSLVEQFTAEIITKVFNNVGKNEELKSFYPKRQYFLVQRREATPIRLKKKNVLSVLGKKAELEAFLKKEKIKLDTEEQLIRVLKFYENQ